MKHEPELQRDLEVPLSLPLFELLHFYEWKHVLLASSEEVKKRAAASYIHFLALHFAVRVTEAIE